MRTFLKIWISHKLPGGLVVGSKLSVPGAWVQSLARKLRSCKPCGKMPPPTPSPHQKGKNFLLVDKNEPRLLLGPSRGFLCVTGHQPWSLSSVKCQSNSCRHLSSEIYFKWSYALELFFIFFYRSGIYYFCNLYAWGILKLWSLSHRKNNYYFSSKQ